jgi:PAS domain S-box-containing protein
VSAPLPADLLSLVLDTLPVRIFWKDLDSRFLGCNQSFAADCGVASPAEVIGKTTHEIRPSGEADAFRADDLQVIQTGRPKLNIEESFQHPDGETRWIEINKMPLVSDAGEIIGVLCTYHDITERVRARHERQRLIEDLVSARDAAVATAQAKSAFVAGMSHELRTPLNAIIGYAEMLKEEWAPNEDAAKDLDQIVSGGRHLLAIFNDILDMSKLTAGRMVAHSDIVSPAAIVGEVMDLMAPMAAGNGAALNWRASPPAFTTRCDSVKLRQCVSNLVSNACKFTKNGSIDVEVHVDEEGGAFEIAVSDTGIGISPAQMENLFQAFSQGDTNISRDYGGTGLGLVITRSLAQLMGGDVSVESALGQGSTFTLRLPRRAVSDKNAERAAQAA